MKARYRRYVLETFEPLRTSREVLRRKETYFIILEDGQKVGYGEASLFRGLSSDDRSDYEETLKWVCEHIHLGLSFFLDHLIPFPSIRFGLEQAFLSLNSNDGFELILSDFTKGKDSIQINGLIWMGSESLMRDQIVKKMDEGYSTIKLKIGFIDLKKEIKFLEGIRARYSSKLLTLRLDANGVFSFSDALEKLNQLSHLDIHSIEQPIARGQIAEMADLCEKTPIPIALDEELIGVFNCDDKRRLLISIKPQYLVLKPSLIGGIKSCNEWIEIARELKISYWITSALESNIGLNSICQYAHSLNIDFPQGLGTGNLFKNNFEVPLEIKNDRITYNKKKRCKIAI